MIDLSHPHLGPSHSILQSTHELLLRLECVLLRHTHTLTHTHKIQVNVAFDVLNTGGGLGQ